MRIKQLIEIRVLVCITLMFSTLSVGAAEEADTSRAVTSAEEAVKLALEYTGFAELDELALGSPEKVVARAVIGDSMTPFLSDYIDGRVAWRVDIDSVFLKLKTANPEPEPAKHVSVYIDSLTGDLLRAKFTLPGKDSVRVQESTSEEMARHLTSFDEVIHGLPDRMPAVTLLEAIRLDRFYPLLAKEIVVWYVQYSRDTLEPRPVWLICMLGMPPVSNNQYVRDNMQMDRRFVVDAIEGHSLIGLFYGFDRKHEETGP